MASAVRKLLFGSTLLFLLLGAFSFACALKLPSVDPGSMRARFVEKLFADHLKSFSALEGLLQVYLMSYKGALQESFVVQSRWIDELRGSGDLAGRGSGFTPGGLGKGAPASRYSLHGARGGLQYYIDRNGEFHFVSVRGGGKTRSDIMIGFDPLREALSGMAKKPRGVLLFDEKNGTGSPVYQRGRKEVGKGKQRYSPDGIDVRFSRIGSVRFSKDFRLDGDALLLVTEYDFPSVESRFILFGLFIVFALAILVVVSTGASLFGGIALEGRKMYGKTGEDDIVNQIDREISAGVSASKRSEPERDTPVSEDKETEDKETEGKETEGLEITEAVIEDRATGRGKTLENDGIIIKKS
jgi:hypothetical protein